MKTKAEIIDLLKAIDLFADLSKKELSLLASSMRPESYAAGQEIVREGETDGRFFVLTSGTAVARANGKKLSTIGIGQCFGEIALIDRGPRTATVVAAEPVEAMSVACFTFRPVLKANPDLQYKLMLKLCERLRVADRHLVG